MISRDCVRARRLIQRCAPPCRLRISCACRCLTDWFGSSTAVSRCPAGSASEPVRLELVIVPLVVFALAVLLVEWTVAQCKKRRTSIVPAATLVAVVPEATPSAPPARSPAAADAAVSAATTKWNSAYSKVHVLRALSGKGGGAVAAKPAKATGIGPDPMKLTFHDVSFRIGKNRVLSGVNATLRHGELIALMGESGSGKTTLLNVIAGRASYGDCTGDISFNGRPFDPQAISLGFVPQAYLVFKELTVYENVRALAT